MDLGIINQSHVNPYSCWKPFKDFKVGAPKTNQAPKHKYAYHPKYNGIKDNPHSEPKNVFGKNSEPTLAVLKGHSQHGEGLP